MIIREYQSADCQELHFSIVAVDVDIIVGFGDVDKTGYLDRLFVHSD